MNNRPEDKNNMPLKRNPNSSARGHSIRQSSGQVRRPVQNQNARPASRKQVPPHAQRPAQAPAPRAVKKAPQKQTTQLNKGIVKLLVFSVAVLLIVLLIAGTASFISDENELLIREVTIEAGGSKPDISMFFSEEPRFMNLVSSNLNFDEVNIDLPQSISFNISVYGKNNACKLIIRDSVPPTGEGIPQKIFACQELPDALSCITGINDVTDVSAEWRDAPDMSAGGSFVAVAVLIDGCGNETPVNVPFEVTKDDTAPEIKGALDIEAYIGDPVSYREKVIVTDDYDENPVLAIDTSNVDLNEEGEYEVVYTATDFSGNESSVTITLTMMEKPEGYVEPEVVYEEARKILDEITEPGMTDEEVALQIVWWCRYNIRFILRTESSSWTEAAYNAFIYRTGNCYSTVYAVKALLDVAGFENMIIERYPYETATHFWNYVLINGQWYHCDSTWRQGYDGYFFMYTTEELLDFWQGGWNGFQFDQDKYPESATESVQSRIDYENHTIESP